jgi:hypothetical protein
MITMTTTMPTAAMAVVDAPDVVAVLVTVVTLTDGGEVEDDDTDGDDVEDEETDDDEDEVVDDIDDVGEEVEDEDDVLVTLTIDVGRIYESAVILNTAPGSSNELGAVGQSAIF